MGKLLNGVMAMSCVVHAGALAKAEPNSDRSARAFRGGALVDALTSRRAVHEANQTSTWLGSGWEEPREPIAKANGAHERKFAPGTADARLERFESTSIRGAGAFHDADHGLPSAAQPKRPESGRRASEPTGQVGRPAQSSHERESTAGGGHEGLRRRVANAEAAARRRETRQFRRDHALDAAGQMPGPKDTAIQRAAEAVLSSTRAGAFPLFPAQRPAAPAKQDATDTVVPVVKPAPLGGGPLLYRLDLTQLYGHEEWVKPLLAQQYLIPSEPLMSSSLETPRPVADEISVVVPVPSSLTLAAAGAIACLAGQTAVCRRRRPRRTGS